MSVTRIKPVKDGEKTFMRCACKPGGTDFLAVAIVGEFPLICALVCPECESEMTVLNGFVGAQ